MAHRAPPAPGQLSRRERQVMDLLFEHGRATAAELHERLPDPPSYSAVRALLRTLGEKGHVLHEQDGPRYVYRPAVPRATAREGAVRRLLRTFFDDSVPAAVAGLLGERGQELSDAELDELEAMIRAARARREPRP
ncbi:MAG: BlaI/MecI/CopY family transcriptional regulator [Pseudomonadales bacterium]|nr:BlaI/MecI/CopY family transcriptional regulator [Pseudomonadales bacterium]